MARNLEPRVENWVIFSIRGKEFNPDVITMNLQIEPDRVYYPGEAGEEALWQLRSSLPGSESLEAHFWEVLQRLLPAHKSLMNFARDASLLFSGTILTSKEADTVIDLSPRLLILVGHLGAALKIGIQVREDSPF